MILRYFWPLLLVAAGILEVGGDAAVRKGLRDSGISAVIVGCVILGCYALVVNSIPWHFGKLLGVYVAVFALVSILWGRWVLKEVQAPSTIVGTSIIVVGGLVISWSEVALLIRGLWDLIPRQS